MKVLNKGIAAISRQTPAATPFQATLIKKQGHSVYLLASQLI